MRHGVRLVEPHLVGEALRAHFRHRAAHQHQLSRGDLVVEVDGQRGHHGAQPARPHLLQRDARHRRDVPARVVEERGVLAHVHVPVAVAVRGQHHGAHQVEPFHLVCHLAR